MIIWSTLRVTMKADKDQTELVTDLGVESALLVTIFQHIAAKQTQFLWHGSPQRLEDTWYKCHGIAIRAPKEMTLPPVRVHWTSSRHCQPESVFKMKPSPLLQRIWGFSKSMNSGLKLSSQDELKLPQEPQSLYGSSESPHPWGLRGDSCKRVLHSMGLPNSRCRISYDSKPGEVIKKS